MCGRRSVLPSTWMVTPMLSGPSAPSRHRSAADRYLVTEWRGLTPGLGRLAGAEDGKGEQAAAPRPVGGRSESSGGVAALEPSAPQERAGRPDLSSGGCLLGPLQPRRSASGVGCVLGRGQPLASLTLPPFAHNRLR